MDLGPNLRVTNCKFYKMTIRRKQLLESYAITPLFILCFFILGDYLSLVWVFFFTDMFLSGLKSPNIMTCTDKKP